MSAAYIRISLRLVSVHDALTGTQYIELYYSSPETRCLHEAYLVYKKIY